MGQEQMKCSPAALLPVSFQYRFPHEEDNRRSEHANNIEYETDAIDDDREDLPFFVDVERRLRMNVLLSRVNGQQQPLTLEYLAQNGHLQLFVVDFTRIELCLHFQEDLFDVVRQRMLMHCGRRNSVIATTVVVADRAVRCPSARR